VFPVFGGLLGIVGRIHISSVKLLLKYASSGDVNPPTKNEVIGDVGQPVEGVRIV
jgi:hypothetical protein